LEYLEKKKRYCFQLWRWSSCHSHSSLHWGCWCPAMGLPMQQYCLVVST
jgi:hypothetical protein